MYGTDFWTLWEKMRVGCFERTASKHVYYQRVKQITVLPVVRVPSRERRLLETMQLAIGEFITDS